MLPPSTTGWTGSAARMAAVSEAVVVLPFVPVTPIVGADAQAQEQVGLGDEGRARRVAAGSRGDEGLQGRPQARLGRRVVRVDRRRRRHERGARPGGRRVDVRAEGQRDAPALERGDRVGRAASAGRPS